MLVWTFVLSCEPLLLAQDSLEVAAWAGAFQEAWVAADSLGVDFQAAAEVVRYDWFQHASDSVNDKCRGLRSNMQMLPMHEQPHLTVLHRPA